MTKKEIEKSFLQLAGRGKVKVAFDNFVSNDFIHHNQYFHENRAALSKAMADAHQHKSK